MKGLAGIAILIVLGLSSCGNGGNRKAAEPDLTAKDTVKAGDTAHSSMNALDWEGTYKGNLPCADCDGVAVELILRKDLTYESSSKYVGKAVPDLAEKGTFTWNSGGSKITLHPEGGSPVQYLVGENRVIQLDAGGNKLTGPLSDRFILVKQTAANAFAATTAHGDAKLKETYWKLVELDGKPVAPPKFGRREPHLIFKEKDSLVNGFAGCNTLTGKYILKEGKQISFTGVASTLMTCLNMRVEDEFRRVLQQTDNYAIKGDTLSLNKAKMAPLARFSAVFIR